MKIAYLCISILPSRNANSVHVMKMAQALIQEGNEVTVFAPDRPGTEEGVEDLAQFYGTEVSVPVEKLSWPAHRGRPYVFARHAARRAVECGVDLAYGRSLHACYFAARAGLPVVFETHAPMERFNVVERWMLRRLLRRGNFRHLVVISEALRRLYVEPGHISPERVLVAHDAADPPRSGEGRDPLPPAPLRVGYVGHLYPGRGIEVLVHLAEHCPWAEFHAIGGRPAEIEDWRARTAQLPNLTFHGFLPPAVVDAYRCACDVLLAPYQRTVTIEGQGDTSKWMSPLKIFEYMAAGRAILCSDLPVLHEVLTDGETTLFCPPDDHASWVRALERLRDPQLREQLGKRTREVFAANYTWRRRAERVLAPLAAAPAGVVPETAAPQ